MSYEIIPGLVKEASGRARILRALKKGYNIDDMAKKHFFSSLMRGNPKQSVRRVNDFISSRGAAAQHRPPPGGSIKGMVDGVRKSISLRSQKAKRLGKPINDVTLFG
jgi:hypothetical protein